MDLGSKLQVAALGGATPEQAKMAMSPIPYSSITLYNPESGFASFLIPAVLILVLQQSLILGIGRLAGGIYEHKKLHRYYSNREMMHNNIMHIVFGKAICYYSLYIVSTMYILCTIFLIALISS